MLYRSLPLFALMLTLPAVAWASAGDAAKYAKACERGKATSCFNVGLMYKDGMGVRADAKKAATYLGKACDAKVAKGCMHLGLLEDEAKAHARALAHFATACQGGEVQACGLQGYKLHHGEGVARDASKAARLFERACKGGVTSSCVSLGVMLMEGDGVRANAKRALALHKRTCRAGEARGCFYQAVLSEKKPVFDTRRLKVYVDTCKAGYAPACYRAGDMLSRGERPEPKTIAKMHKKACEGGSAWGCRALGLMYASGPQGVPKDPKRALDYTRRACSMKLESACQELRMLASRLCDEGSAKTCLMVANQYGPKGMFKRDDVIASMMYQKACKGWVVEGCQKFEKTMASLCDAGDMGRCAVLAGLYRKGTYVEKNAETAFALYSKSCDGAHGEACYEAARLMSAGKGVSRHRRKAKTLYTRACEQGYTKACKKARK